MTAVAAGLALASLLLFAWSYGVYPPLIRALARRRGARGEVPATGERPVIEAIVSAADEEEVIGARVLNLLGEEGLASVAIGCDGSGDRTAERARAAAGNAAVRIVEFPGRRGKAAVVNDLVRTSVADILVFTDANTRFEAGAVAHLTGPFADPEVGAVCGRLVIATGAGAQATPESALWERETQSKEAEGRLGVCVGANGAIYAARRRLYVALPEDTTSMDDFLIPVRVARAGGKVVFASEAIAREDAARDVAAETARRFRIGIGAGQVLRRERWLWNASRHPMLTLAYASRKAARWLAPLSALAAAAAALGAPAWRAPAAAALLLAAMALAASRARPHLTGLAGRLYYFGVLNLALALGVAAGLCGYARPVWKRTARS